MKIKIHILLLFFLLVKFTGLEAQWQYGWVERSGLPAQGRHRSSCCAVGNRAYVGLGHINNNQGEILYDDWWEYDPGTDTWMQRSNFPGGKRYEAPCTGAGDHAYILSGTDSVGNQLTDFWSYSPVTNSWQMVAAITPGNFIFGGATMFSISDKVYIISCFGLPKTVEYDPVTGSWTTKASPPAGAFYSYGATVVNTKAYTGSYSGWFEYDAVNNSWAVKTTCPNVPPQEYCGHFEYNGQIYLVSGLNTQMVSVYNPATDQWTQAQNFPGQARYYMLSVNIGPRVFGGMGTNGVNLTDWWEFGNMVNGEIENSQSDAISMYPNPAIENVTVKFSSTVHEAKIQITDVNGKLVRRIEHISGNEITIERNEIISGTYFIQIEENGKTKSVQKIIFR